MSETRLVAISAEDCTSLWLTLTGPEADELSDAEQATLRRIVTAYDEGITEEEVGLATYSAGSYDRAHAIARRDATDKLRSAFNQEVLK